MLIWPLESSCLQEDVARWIGALEVDSEDLPGGIGLETQLVNPFSRAGGAVEPKNGS